MQGRKYFRSTIIELEELFSKSSKDFAILEELEEELSNHRETKRARALLIKVQAELNGNAMITDSTFEHVDNDEKSDVINWDEALRMPMINPLITQM